MWVVDNSHGYQLAAAALKAKNIRTPGPLKSQEEYLAKLTEACAEPSRRDRGAEPSEEQRAPSPPDATAAAGSSAVLVQCEARGFSLTLRGGQQKTKRGDIALRLRFVKFDHPIRVCANSRHMGCRQIFQQHAALPWGSTWCLSHCERKICCTHPGPNLIYI